MFWVNVIIVLVFLIYAWEGYRRGFLRQVADLLGIIISIFIAFKYYHWAGSLLVSWGVRENLVDPLGFLSLWILIQVFFYLVIYLIFRLVPLKIEGSITNRIFGLFPGAIKGIIIVAILLMMFVIFPIATGSKEALLKYPISGFLIRSSAKVESQMSQVFGDISNLTFFRTDPQDHEMVKLNFQSNDYDLDVLSEEKMIKLVNENRIKEGLSPLQVDFAIREVARGHSIDMLKNGYFSHINLEGETPADRMLEVNVSFQASGENIALAPTIELAEIGFMNSPKHRDNILDPNFTRIGIGVIDTINYGKMVTQNFAN